MPEPFRNTVMQPSVVAAGQAEAARAAVPAGTAQANPATAPALSARVVAWMSDRFELGRGGGRHNLRPMEGLRGFAVFLVFLVHYVTLVQPWTASSMERVAAVLHSVGNTGVDLFFVLSGYLIYGSLISKPVAFRAFIARRAERIYPAFIAVFILYLALSLLFPNQSKLPPTLLGTIKYLIQNLLLLPGLLPIEPMITVAWSLSYEMFFYLALPALISMLALRTWTSTWRCILFGTGVLATAGFCAAFGGPVRLIMFGAGILLFEVANRPRFPVPSATVAAVALIAALATTLLPLYGTAGFAIKVSALFVAFLVLCRSVFASPRSWLARAFSWTPIRWLGNMSYSYYLLHGLALKAAFVAFALLLPPASPGAWIFWTLLPVAFAVSLVPSAMLFLMVERPYSLTPARSLTPP